MCELRFDQRLLLMGAADDLLQSDLNRQRQMANDR